MVKDVVLAASDTHPRIPGQPVLTTTGSVLGASGASAASRKAGSQV